MKNMDLAIKDWSTRGYMMQDELIKYLPKQFIINYVVFLESIYERLPLHLQSDPDIIDNLRCREHYQFSNWGDEIDGPVIKRKYCYYCKNRITFNLHVDKKENVSPHCSF